MTIQEFSNQFDTLLNSFNASAVFGEEASRQTVTLDEYEKSLFLTKAEEEMVVAFYSGRNPYGESFESVEEMRRYLAVLVKEKNLSPITNTNGIPLGITSTSKFFTLPEDLWFITYEAVAVENSRCPGKVLKVYPTKQDEYQSIKDNPFRGANDRRALRLDLSEGNVEIVCKYLVTTYYIRYIRKVAPIILVDLPDELSINGVKETTECELPEVLHQRILERAVLIALQSKGYSQQKESK